MGLAKKEINHDHSGPAIALQAADLRPERSLRLPDSGPQRENAAREPCCESRKDDDV